MASWQNQMDNKDKDIEALKDSNEMLKVGLLLYFSC